MRCDYETLASYLALLDTIFNYINEVFSNLEFSNNTVKNSNNWEGPASDFYSTKAQNLLEQFDTISAHFTNIKGYIENVINNYYMIDMNLGNTISGG